MGVDTSLTVELIVEALRGSEGAILYIVLVGEWARYMWGAICRGWSYPCYLTYSGFYGLLGTFRTFGTLRTLRSNPIAIFFAYAIQCSSSVRSTFVPFIEVAPLTNLRTYRLLGILRSNRVTFVSDRHLRTLRSN